VLDRWALARLNRLVKTVTEGLEAYDVTGATRPIGDFVEELSNWYLRLSRRRFWNTDSAQRANGQTLNGDGLAAHQTLYEILVTLAQLLAPFTPFIADEIYRNLVCHGDDAGLPGTQHALSVHLSGWPQPRPEYENEQLLADMLLAQKVVGLGRAARESAALKLRQPLAEAIVGLPTGREAEALLSLADAVVKEELNVKTVKTVEAGSDLVDVAIHPLPKQLGQKHGRRFPAIKAALLALDPLAVAAAVEAGRSVTVTADGESVEVLPDEVQVRKSPKPGLAVAEDAGYLVAITTELTDALRWEGWAREITRNIQELRKKSGFEISDRIHTTVQAGSALAPVWLYFGSEISQDTLSISFTQAAPVPGAFTAELRLDAENLLIGVRKA
jgi:isoleucyl-tRNA synthetase